MTDLAGTGSLVRLIVRLERTRLPVWIAVISVLVLLTASSFSNLYPDEASRELLATSIGRNPSLVAFYGPMYDTGIGGLVAWRLGILMPVLVGLLSIFTIVRYTRRDEEAGRRELLGSTVIGRHAAVTAVLLVVLVADLLIGVLVAAGLAGIGLDPTGSIAFGMATMAGGWTFAAIAAVTAQLTESARTANGLAAALLGAFFVVRIAGDAGQTLSWLAWLSPIGWAIRIRPFADEQWWVLMLFGVTIVSLLVTAYALSAQRDVGAGILPQRSGSADAAPWLRSPLSLAWRLHRGLLAGWVAGFAVFGIVIGAVADGVTELLDDSPQLRELFERLGGAGGLVDLFISTVMGLFGVIAAAYAVQATLRLRSEELGLRAEPVLATAVDRVHWATSHLVFGLAGPAVALAISGVTAGLTHGLVTGAVGRELPRILGAALVQLPAVWVLAGLAMALFGLLPRFVALTWTALIAFLILGQLGELLQLDQILLDLSPFTHVPQVPATDVTASPLVWLVVVAAVLIAAGLTGFRRRDVG